MCADDLDAQLEVTKHFLEYAHGHAIRYDNPGEAWAYNDALTLLDDAREHNWDVEREDLLRKDHPAELIAASRRAREHGYEAATLADQRRERWRQRHHRPSLLERLLARLGVL